MVDKLFKVSTIMAITAIALYIVATIVAIPASMYMQGRDSQLNDMRAVYTVCHTAADKQCQDAQERTSTEYLCNTNGNCWVEVK